MNRSSAKIIKFPVQKEKTQQSQIHYLWDCNRQIQEYNDTHVFTTVYEQDSFEPVARLVWLQDGVSIAANVEPDDEVWTQPPNPINDIEILHFHNDHLGTPNELTNTDGEVVWLADYEAWGNTAKVVWREEKLQSLQVAKEHLQPLRFQGQYYDEETGLHYNRFRYFDPDLGMFTTRDPIGLMGGDNVFQYAPNPTGWIDPFGLSCVKNKKTSYNASSRRDALRQAKRDAGIPKSQKPEVSREYLRDGNGDKIMNQNNQPVTTRNYQYKNNKGESIVIQEHSHGHTKATKNHGSEPHFNVRPANNTNTGSVEGTHGHYNF